MYFSTGTIPNKLSPHECSRCRSNNVTQTRETSAYRFGYFILFTRHQSVKFTAPVCDSCAELFDRRELLVGKIVIALFAILVIILIGAFIKLDFVGAILFSVVSVFIFLFVISLVGWVVTPRLARFTGHSIIPLKRR